ncbi:MAG: hypothetical protein C4521_01835 [Actinobacteria bacterium]|nr:MAG: hypothetical protein C4521_01835 [Actinomycetota bacterium]
MAGPKEEKDKNKKKGKENTLPASTNYLWPYAAALAGMEVQPGVSAKNLIGKSVGTPYPDVTKRPTHPTRPDKNDPWAWTQGVNKSDPLSYPGLALGSLGTLNDLYQGKLDEMFFRLTDVGRDNPGMKAALGFSPFHILRDLHEAGVPGAAGVGAMALDPLNFLGFGLFGKAASLLSKGSKLGKATPAAVKTLQALDKAEKVPGQAFEKMIKGSLAGYRSLQELLADSNRPLLRGVGRGMDFFSVPFKRHPAAEAEKLARDAKDLLNQMKGMGYWGDDILDALSSQIRGIRRAPWRWKDAPGKASQSQYLKEDWNRASKAIEKLRGVKYGGETSTLPYLIGAVIDNEARAAKAARTFQLTAEVNRLKDLMSRGNQLDPATGERIVERIDKLYRDYYYWSSSLAKAIENEATQAAGRKWEELFPIAPEGVSPEELKKLKLQVKQAVDEYLKMTKERSALASKGAKWQRQSGGENWQDAVQRIYETMDVGNMAHANQLFDYAFKTLGLGKVEDALKGEALGGLYRRMREIRGQLANRPGLYENLSPRMRETAMRLRKTLDDSLRDLADDQREFMAKLGEYEEVLAQVAPKLIADVRGGKSVALSLSEQGITSTEDLLNRLRSLNAIDTKDFNRLERLYENWSEAGDLIFNQPLDTISQNLLKAEHKRIGYTPLSKFGLVGNKYVQAVKEMQLMSPSLHLTNLIGILMASQMHGIPADQILRRVWRGLGDVKNAELKAGGKLLLDRGHMGMTDDYLEFLEAIGLTQDPTAISKGLLSSTIESMPGAGGGKRATSALARIPGWQRMLVGLSSAVNPLMAGEGPVMGATAAVLGGAAGRYLPKIAEWSYDMAQVIEQAGRRSAFQMGYTKNIQKQLEKFLPELEQILSTGVHGKFTDNLQFGRKPRPGEVPELEQFVPANMLDAVEDALEKSTDEAGFKQRLGELFGVDDMGNLLPEAQRILDYVMQQVKPTKTDIPTYNMGDMVQTGQATQASVLHPAQQLIRQLVKPDIEAILNFVGEGKRFKELQPDLEAYFSNPAKAQEFFKLLNSPHTLDYAQTVFHEIARQRPDLMNDIMRMMTDPDETLRALLMLVHGQGRRKWGKLTLPEVLETVTPIYERMQGLPHWSDKLFFGQLDPEEIAGVRRHLEGTGGLFNPQVLEQLLHNTRAQEQTIQQLVGRWRELQDEAVQEGINLANHINFDYGTPMNLEVWLRNWTPFTTWALRVLPFFGQHALQHPIMLETIMKLNQAGENEELGLTDRFKQFVPAGKLGDALLSALTGRDMEMMVNPLRPFPAPTGLGKLPDRPMQSSAENLVEFMQALGLGPGPWAEAALQVMSAAQEGATGQRGFYGNRPTPSFMGNVSRILPRHVFDPELLPRTTVETLRRMAGQEPFDIVDYQVRRRLAEMSVEQTGRPRHNEYLWAMTNKSSPLYKQALKDVSVERTLMSLLSFLAPISAKGLSSTEREVRNVQQRAMEAEGIPDFLAPVVQGALGGQYPGFNTYRDVTSMPQQPFLNRYGLRVDSDAKTVDQALREYVRWADLHGIPENLRWTQEAVTEWMRTQQALRLWKKQQREER